MGDSRPCQRALATGSSDQRFGVLENGESQERVYDVGCSDGAGSGFHQSSMPGNNRRLMSAIVLSRGTRGIPRLLQTGRTRILIRISARFITSACWKKPQTRRWSTWDALRLECNRDRISR
ncbi:MAG: hypothetical protein CM1200mP9_08370 [Gammaproteobacteria bacterium]|nr:MAG: hypothetical protein CM1200mP9_08370 [Gammaproteobacteria bacterium]